MKMKLCALLGIFMIFDSIVVRSLAEEEGGILECILEANSASCARKKIAKEIDEMEFEVSGTKSDVPMSVVLEEAGNFVAEGFNNFFATDDNDNNQNDESESRGMSKLIIYFIFFLFY